MKPKIKITITIGISFFLIGLILYVISSRISCPRSEVPNTGIENMPKFIYSMWPPPQGKISTICYIKSRNKTPLDLRSRGISVELHIASIVDLEIPQKENEGYQQFKERVFLYVNGVLIPNSSRAVFENLIGIEITKDGNTYLMPDLSKAYIFSWTPMLTPGHHTANIVINTKSGNVLEYQWSFLIW